MERHCPRQGPELKHPRGRKQNPGARGEELAAGKGHGRGWALRGRKPQDPGRKERCRKRARETGGQPKCAQGPGDEGEGGAGVKAPPKRESTRSGPGRERVEVVSRSPRTSARPTLPRRSRGPTPPRPGEARVRIGGPPGPSAPRLPRPRLPPAGPRAWSPAHAAGRGPQPPGWDGAELPAATAGPGVLEQAGGAPGRPLG